MRMYHQNFGADYGHSWKKKLDEFLESAFGFVDEVEWQRPAVNLSETKKAFEVQLAAPGLEKSDFIIQIVGDHLEISVKKKATKDENKEWIKRGFSYQNFKRRIKISDQVDRSKVKASYKQGILTVTLPKLKSQRNAEGQDIPVE